MAEHYRLTTPEQFHFEFELAGFFSRFLAWLIDCLIIIGLTILVSIALAILAGFAEAFEMGGVVYAGLAVAPFVIRWGYFVLFEWRWSGQSPGKKALGLRVLSYDGVSVSLYQSFIRNLLRLVDSLPMTYLVGGATAMISAHGQRLGDLAANTIVVRERRSTLPAQLIPAEERYNTLLEDRAVRQKVIARLTKSEREVLVSLALRRESVPMSVRLQLYAELAEHLQEKLSLERPEFFSDEKFCLNITAMLLRSGLQAPT